MIKRINLLLIKLIDKLTKTSFVINLIKIFTINFRLNGRLLKKKSFESNGNLFRLPQAPHSFEKNNNFGFFKLSFMAIFTTLSVIIWFSMGTLGIFATLVYVFTMRVVIYDILSMAIIPTLSTSILFCNSCYILLWISPRSVVKIAIRI